jgi:hypothetical protein
MCNRRIVMFMVAVVLATLGMAAVAAGTASTTLAGEGISLGAVGGGTKGV